MDTPYETNDTEKGPGIFICRLLQYLECPPYLRNILFPIHNDLKFASLLPNLDMPHHLKDTTVSMYREGVVVDRLIADGCMVNIGLENECFIGYTLQPNIRVTVKLSDQALSSSSSGKHF